MTLGSPSKFWIVVGALCAALSVGFGAFGAHGLNDVIGKTFVPPESREITADITDGIAPPETKQQFVKRRLENWDAGARYQMYHALGLIFVGIIIGCGNRKLFQAAAVLFLIGILLFSGMLYVLVLTNIKILGAIVPLGGLSFIVGWLLFALAIAKGPTTAALQGASDDQ